MPDSSQPSAAAILDQLVRERGPTLRAMARSAVAGDADDVFQGACVGFLRSFDPATAYGGLDGAQQYLQTAIFNQARRGRRTDRRREHALPRLGPVDELDPLDLVVAVGANPEERAVRRFQLKDAEEQLAELPSEWRRVLLAQEMGYSPSEIQAALHLSPRQYRKRLDQAHARLNQLRSCR